MKYRARNFRQSPHNMSHFPIQTSFFFHHVPGFSTCKENPSFLPPIHQVVTMPSATVTKRLRDLCKRGLHSLSSRFPQQDFDLMSLPIDLIYPISRHLSAADMLALSLTCHPLFGLLFEDAKYSLEFDSGYRREAETKSLVSRLGRDVADTHSYCDCCITLHSLPILPTPNEDMVVTYNSRIPIYAERLLRSRVGGVINRFPHHMYLLRKQIRWKIREEGLTSHFSATLQDKMRSGRWDLLLIVRHEFHSNDVETLASHMHKRRRWLCSHLNDEVAQALRHAPPPDGAGWYCPKCSAHLTIRTTAGAAPGYTDGQATRYSIIIKTKHWLVNPKWEEIVRRLAVTWESRLVDG